mmetsp:Transcript_58855/g.154770  ORF Transcript_58855/g.154770 Transcript_58855/m.154770 type:complete len:322 (-) Transcript_58855:1945-2910(-)
MLLLSSELEAAGDGVDLADVDAREARLLDGGGEFLRVQLRQRAFRQRVQPLARRLEPQLHLALDRLRAVQLGLGRLHEAIVNVRGLGLLDRLDEFVAVDLQQFVRRDGRAQPHRRRADVLLLHLAPVLLLSSMAVLRLPRHRAHVVRRSAERRREAEERDRRGEHRQQSALRALPLQRLLPLRAAATAAATAALATTAAALAAALAAVRVLEVRLGRHGVVHAGHVERAHLDAVALLVGHRHLPRLVHKLRGEVRELWHPVAHVGAVRVVILRLLHNIEAVDAPPGEAGGGGPIAPIGTDVVIEQQRLEMVGAVPPVDLQV